jgi:hypothetical protein
MFIAAQVVTLTLRAYAVVQRDQDCQGCLYFSLLGLSLWLAFLHLCGPPVLVLLAKAG